MSETGLDYFGARYFSGAQGRFSTPDEFTGGIVDPFTGDQVGQPGPLPYADITNPQSLNKYAYVLNNPLRYTDPDGHCSNGQAGDKGGTRGGQGVQSMQQIAAFVKKQGWTQVEAAQHCGVTQPRINDLLRGRVSRFSLDALVNISTALGCRVRVDLEAA